MKIKYLIGVLLCASLLSSCAKISDSTYEEAEKTVFAMDTVMTLKAYGENAKTAIDSAEDEIMRLDTTLRRKNTDSEVYKINTEKSADVSDDTASLIKKALDICSSTNGAFDISIAPVMDLWGFYTKEFHVPSEQELALGLEKVDFNNITAEGNTVSVKDNTELDLGGIAKGFLSQRIMEIFRDNGIRSGIVSLGGNVQTLGEKIGGGKWKVAIQSPDDDSYLGIVNVSDMAVITSGGYQRFFEQDGMIYHHIIDPKTGYSANRGLKSVTIVSSDGTLADGLSTALFVMGLDKGTDYWKDHDGFDVIFVTDDDQIYITSGLDGIFESENNYSIITK